jgi:hypothetical protein
MDKFRELDAVELDPLPENICMRIDFQPGQLNLGTLKICEMTPLDDDEREGEVEEEEEADAALEEEEEEEENVNVEEKKTKNDVEISNINSEPTKTFVSIATQTEDMTTITTTTQAVQTVDESLSTNDLNPENGPLSPSIVETSSSAPPGISSDNISNIYDQSNKLSRRVRRLLKPTCSVAVLPNTDVIILDCEQNLASILDKKGKFKYCFTSEIPTAERKGFAVSGFSSTANVSNAPAGSNRTVRIPTQQGILCIKLKNERVSELPFGFTVHAFNSISETDN